MRQTRLIIGIIGVVAVLVLAATATKSVKGNGESMLYHLPGCPNYDATKTNNHPRDERFWTEAGARRRGFTKASNCK